MPTPLEQSLFRVLAYFAYFRFPLTPFECWKWCDLQSVTVSDVEQVLESSALLRDWGCREASGFFGLGDAAQWQAERMARVTDALRKSRRAERFVRTASRLPWVKMIAVCNSLAFSFTSSESDIDLFIVTTRGRMWSTRLLLTGALACMRARPGERKHDPICLSFFATEDRLDFSDIKIGASDPYLAYWITTLSPVMDTGGICAKLHAANGWIRPVIPRVSTARRASWYSVLPGRTLPDIGWFEHAAERIQRAKFPAALRDMMNRDTRVIVTDSMLKFHHNDRRQDILNAYETLLAQRDHRSAHDSALPPAMANAVDV